MEVRLPLAFLSQESICYGMELVWTIAGRIIIMQHRFLRNCPSVSEGNRETRDERRKTRRETRNERGEGLIRL
jgi:hypothetical protein